MSVVHVAVTRNVRSGMEEQFDAKLLSFIRESMSSEGVLGVHILRPAPQTGSREYGVLRTFESEEAAEKFYASELFHRWLDDAEPLVEGEPEHRRLTGLEAFFRSGRGAMPPRWKMACLTFLGVFPAVLFWSTVLLPVLEGQHWLVFSVAVNVCVVVTLTWLVMPCITRIFHPWLQTGHAERISISR